MSKKHKKARHQCVDITEEKIKALKRSMTKEQIEEIAEIVPKKRDRKIFNDYIAKFIYDKI